MGIEYMTRHLKCLAVSCDWKDNCTTLASVSDADALFPLWRLYLRQADANRLDRAMEDAWRAAERESYERQAQRMRRKIGVLQDEVSSLRRPQVQL